MSIVHWSPPDDRAAPETLVARAFGTGLHDLTVDILAPLDIAISAVLQGCLSSLNGDAFSGADISGWTVAKRRQGLLAVVVSTNGPLRSLTTVCGNPDCGAKMDFDLDLTLLRQDWREDRVAVTLDSGETLTLRHPVPADLALWANTAAEGPAETELARILLVGKVPDSPDWENAAQEALSAADRLADLELRADCPDCGAPATYSLVLEPFLLEELSQESGRLMDEIHLLAMSYHWTEPDILALPESRRRHYLTRIQEAWAA